MKARLSAISTFVPEKQLTNADLEKMIDTSDEWIVKRTGIKTRHIADENTFVSHLCEEAARKLTSQYSKDLTDVDFVISASISPDSIMPSVAGQLQHRLGIQRAGTMDISSACAGFSYGLILAKGLIESGLYKKILVFGGETLSKVTDYTDRATCILFGDGAGAALVEAAQETNMLKTTTGTDGHEGHNLVLGTRIQEINGTDIPANDFIHQDGKKVFKWAVETISREAQKLVNDAGLSMEDIDWFVPHSANMRIIEAITRNLGLPSEKTLESLRTCGNTSSASIPLAIDQGFREGKVKPGDKLLLMGFGGGLTYAGCILEWPEQ
ncbi:MAG: ketoacyl-ACP synthase III [Cytophagales bacterium]|nr:ketoacyl-ACP synthase III [Cytophagales bacterium]